MSHLADILDAERAALVERWTARLAHAPGVPPTSETGLRDHIPDVMRELTAALRAGAVPALIATARAHGVQRAKIGFDLELLVREYGLLRDVIFDVIEEQRVALDLGELRVISDLLTLASAQGVDAHVRRQEEQRIATEESAEVSERALRLAGKAQEKQLQAVLDALPVLVSFVTAELRYALVNEAYGRWFGLPTDAIVGRTVAELIGAPAYAKLEPFVRRALAGECFDFEEHGVPYARGRRDVRVSFIPRHDAGGRVAGYVSLLTDITAERALANERERLLERIRSIVAAAPIGIATWRGPDHVFETANELYLAAFEESPDIVGRRLADVFAARGKPHPAASAFDVVYRTGTPFTARELRVADPDLPGGERVYVFMLRALRGDDGHVDGLIASIADVTEMVQSRVLVEIERDTANVVAEMEARSRMASEAARKTAEEATAAKDDFLAHVSHDLRNPLGAILGWTELLRSTTDPAQVSRGIDVIERNARAQVQLIEDLLDVSRIMTGKLALERTIEDVRVAIDTALDPARISAREKEVTLVATVADDVGKATVDPGRFRQIVWNLVSNAVKFTPPGGSVLVDVSRIDGTLRIVVADTGRGIAPAFLPRIFHRFEQASSDRQRSGGLGLGLAIVRNLVELHGGIIAVESPGAGRGATFTVDLPICATPEPPPSVRAPGPLRGKRVLVVDDQEDVRMVVEVVLEMAGAEVTGAASADEAMSCFLRVRPDALVSDVGMPIKDGYALVREIRGLSTERGGNVVAVALTALAQPKDHADALAAGFDEHLTKPIHGGRLVEVVAALLASHSAPKA